MTATVDQRMWEMRNGAEIADIVRKTLREHRDQLRPDDRGRMHACSCSWWQPGTTWAEHLIAVLTDAGLDLGLDR